MLLYLVRHAHAVDADENALRPLSAKGWSQVARLVDGFRDDGRFEPDEIWHSPLERSRETAALLAAGLGLKAPLVRQLGLEPEDEPETVANALTTMQQRRLAIVGHEPHLGRLLAHLLEAPTEFVFRKASVLALERDGDGWRMRWHTHSKA